MLMDNKFQRFSLPKLWVEHISSKCTYRMWRGQEQVCVEVLEKKRAEKVLPCSWTA